MTTTYPGLRVSAELVALADPLVDLYPDLHAGAVSRWVGGHRPPASRR